MTAEDFNHERVLVRRGPRSGYPVILAVHSTTLGPAIGGCRLAHYPQWMDGLADALRLSAAMTAKCAVAGLPNGGGKTVVVLGDRPPTGVARTAVLHDVGDLIATLDGAYATGPDVGTDPTDMAVIAERTPHVFCRPPATGGSGEAGGSGDSSGHTADGVIAALRALCADVLADPGLRRRFTVLGLGRVGTHLARRLADEGADLIVSDIDPGRRAVADQLGARWLEPDAALRAETDILVPAALGGLLTPATAAVLRCAAIAGPANNQLDEDSTADRLRARGITWVPDFVVSAGGVIHATAVELRHESERAAAARVAGIGDTVAAVLSAARRHGVTPLSAARDLARRRLAAAPPHRLGNRPR